MYGEKLRHKGGTTEDVPSMEYDACEGDGRVKMMIVSYEKTEHTISIARKAKDLQRTPFHLV